MKSLFVHRTPRRAVLIGLGVLALGMAVLAQIPQERVKLAKGTDRTTLKGSLKGPNKDAKDYVLQLAAGQTLSVALEASNKSSTYFNVLPPGSEEALYRGEVEGKNQWEAQVKDAGDYTVRVFLNRAASRKGASSTYTLTVAAF